MLNIVKQLYKFAPQLLGSGYNSCIEYLKLLIDLDVIDVPSGTEVGTWTVPDEWIVKDAWVKFNGKKIIDYKKDPLSLMVYSRPFKGTVTREELKKHLYTSTDRLDATPYEFSFYERKWGVCMPKRKIFGENKKDLLKKGKYEVFIDTEFRPGIMKIAVHTIKGNVARKLEEKCSKGGNHDWAYFHDPDPGSWWGWACKECFKKPNKEQEALLTEKKSDREILLFAHLDHPHQANDNLSGVACLVDLVKRIKKPNHTIKLVFCPETIGSIAYATTQDLSKVDFMIALDAIGSDTELTLQWAYDDKHRLNKIARSTMLHCGEDFKLGHFRADIGSDEYVFNDPKIGIPGLLLTRHPYPEYHTSDDTPDIIKVKKLKYVQDVIMDIIKTYEMDYIPVRNFKGPLMRSKYQAQTPVKKINAQLDYLIYNINGKLWLSEIVGDLGLNYGY